MQKTEQFYVYPADNQLLICLLFQPGIIVVCTVSMCSKLRFQTIRHTENKRNMSKMRGK